jgi:molybdopterin-containing oxidoreductase family iron-sulfur binding subunit
MSDSQTPGPAPAPAEEALGHRLQSISGREFWRSLEELAPTAEFRRELREALPRSASALAEPMDRREFVTLVGAALALSGLAGCGRAPDEKIVPFVQQPEEMVPGKPLFYATAMPHPGGATGLLVRCDMGRPTKVEGNPRHPASLGGTDPWAQASIYSLWDPDRSQAVTRAGAPSTWSAFLGALGSALEAPRKKKGAGIALLTEEVLSPTLASQIETLLSGLPEARWYTYEPSGRDPLAAGSRLAFGQDLDPVYHLDRADVVVSLDADFLSCGPGRERYSHDYTERRRVSGPSPLISRLYVVESALTPTGSMADHRWAVRSSDIEAVARAIAAALGISGAGKGPGWNAPWVSALANDLGAQRGRSLLLAGRDQSAPVHAWAAAINEKLGNAGKTVTYIDPVPFRSTRGDPSLQALAQSMARGEVDVLLILGGNPAYSAPADLDFSRLLSKVAFRVHLGLYEDETSWLCHWHVPETHFLESWSDTQAYDGTASIVQPVLAPLYDGKGAHELVSAAAGEIGRRPYDLVREYWKRRQGPENFETFWNLALHEGMIPGTARPARRPTARVDRISPPGEDDHARPEGLEVVFRPDPSAFDGRFANNAWLQELPKPLTKLTWENAVLLGPREAARRDLASGDVVELSLRGRTVRAPVWILPGHADGSVTLHLGYGRSRAGRVGTGLGFNAGLLRRWESMAWSPGLELRKTGEKARLATTQTHHSMEGRDPVRVTTWKAGSDVPKAAGHEEDREPRPTLYPEAPPGDYAWGMLIDESVCTGCNACVVACQVENNIPVVGKSQVQNGREMHWIRVDSYFTGPPDRPQAVHQPVPCMHCEKAPCELVCPVNATMHSSEGLNQMVYNRCVGTRYCSNNCPYKVRRFNFLQYADFETPSFGEMYNPDVTVRERGVMEKCTYCVQRITRARIAAEAEGRRIRDGELKTACQQACPNGAILFGDLSDRRSQLVRRKASPLHYELLGELNTRPRTTYLARVRNPNPQIEET